MFSGSGGEPRLSDPHASPIELKDDLPTKLLQNLINLFWVTIGQSCDRTQLQNLEFLINQLNLAAADGGDEYNFVAVLEDGVGGDEFQVEAEAGAVAPLF